MYMRQCDIEDRENQMYILSIHDGYVPSFDESSSCMIVFHMSTNYGDNMIVSEKS